MVTATIDYENNSESFWEHFNLRFSKNKVENGYFTFTPEEWDSVKEIDGWNDPHEPEYAPHPLIEVA